MRGWMFRFEDGPLAGKAAGPSPVGVDPPDRLLVLVPDADAKSIRLSEDTPFNRAELAEYEYACYQLEIQSELPELDEASNLVRGATYVLSDDERNKQWGRRTQRLDRGLTGS